MAAPDDQWAEIETELLARRNRLADKLAEVDRAIEGVHLARSICGGRRKAHRLTGQTALVRELVGGMTGSFKVESIVAAIQARDSTALPLAASISSVLRRLCDDGVVEVVERGKGRRATVYRAKGDAAA